MKNFILAVFIILNLILQQTFLTKISILGVKPDLLLVLIIFAALLDGPVAGLKMGLAIGLLQDLVSGKFIGIYTLSALATGFLVGLVETRIFKENYLVPVGVLFAGTVFHELIFQVLRSFTGQTMQGAAGWWAVILPLAVYHAVIGPFLYVPAYKAYVHWWRQAG